MKASPASIGLNQLFLFRMIPCTSVTSFQLHPSFFDCLTEGYLITQIIVQVGVGTIILGERIGEGGEHCSVLLNVRFCNI